MQHDYNITAAYQEEFVDMFAASLSSGSIRVHLNAHM